MNATRTAGVELVVAQTERDILFSLQRSEMFIATIAYPMVSLL